MTIQVVIADDHRMLRDALVMVLERQDDIKVAGQAEDGVEAIERCHALRPDVLVLDIAMPKLNGVEVACSLGRELPQVRILVLSAYTDKRFVYETLKAGAAGYVTKAAALSELPRAIRAIAIGQQYLSPEIRESLKDAVTPDGKLNLEVAPQLSPREREVLHLVADGVRSAAIARRLGITEATVEVHRRNLMRKLDIRNIADLTKYALREGITSL
jgi:two-component system NarL family response regulator